MRDRLRGTDWQDQLPGTGWANWLNGKDAASQWISDALPRSGHSRLYTERQPTSHSGKAAESVLAPLLRRLGLPGSTGDNTDNTDLIFTLSFCIWKISIVCLIALQVCLKQLFHLSAIPGGLNMGTEGRDPNPHRAIRIQFLQSDGCNHPGM